MRVAGCLVAILWASVAVAEQVKVTAGQPLCIDQEGLQTFLLKAIVAGPQSRELIQVNGCQSIVGGSKAEVVERYPSGAEGMRVIKVKVTPPGKGAKSITGYTVEIDR